jgi:hypothetical protein
VLTRRKESWGGHQLLSSTGVLPTPRAFESDCLSGGDLKVFTLPPSCRCVDLGY